MNFSEQSFKIFFSCLLLAGALICMSLATLAILGDLSILDGWTYESCYISGVTQTSRCIYTFECNSVLRPRDIPQCIDYITGDTPYTSSSCTHNNLLCSIFFYPCDGLLMFLTHINESLPIILDCNINNCNSYVNDKYVGCRYNHKSYWPILLNIPVHGFWITMGVFLTFVALILCCAGIFSPIIDDNTASKKYIGRVKYTGVTQP